MKPVSVSLTSFTRYFVVVKKLKALQCRTMLDPDVGLNLSYDETHIQRNNTRRLKKEHVILKWGPAF